MNQTTRTTVLAILDGWGVNPDATHNAIAQAHTPNWDQLWSERPRALIRTSGRAVGLPDGQMGNSEVGHLNIGAGRVVAQDLTRIEQAIADGTLAENPALLDALGRVAVSGGAVHVLGLLSPGGVHSHESQIHALIRLLAARGIGRIYLHAFLDGRDTPPRSAAASLEAAAAIFEELGCGRVASLVGRYYAMDRDQRWERVQSAYDLLTLGQAPYRAADGLAGLSKAYARDESDEFVQPTLICNDGDSPAQIEDGDLVINMNYRADRVRQLTRALIEPEFDGFDRRARPRLSGYLGLTQYHKDFGHPVMFPPISLQNGFGEYLSRLGRTQLRLAETEKYAHVTFFFNGGREDPYPGEERLLVPSPKVATYDLQPQMSAPEVTEHLVEAIASGRFDAIIVNYANGDMVGHTGDMAAAIRAVEVLDDCLGRIVRALEDVDGQMLISADHGNVEQMVDVAGGQVHTAHTCNPVPLVYVGSRRLRLVDEGDLCDIAPTMLAIMELPRPAEMTGRSLVIPGESEAVA